MMHNNIFNRYGKNIFVQIYPKYCDRFQPVLVNFLGIITIVDDINIMSYNNDQPVGTEYTINKDSIALQFNSYDLDGGLTYSNFDIVVQYIPNLS